MNEEIGTLCAELIVRAGLMNAEASHRALSAWTPGCGSPAYWLAAQGLISDEDAKHLDYFVTKAHLAKKSVEAAGSAERNETIADETPPPFRLHRSGMRSAPRDGKELGLPERYRLVTVHAGGGMGRVWIAQDQLMERRVAVKELRPDLKSSQDIEARFLQEIQVTARLEHPGVVPIYDVAPRPVDGSPAFVMRFVEGKTLTDDIHAYHQARKSGGANRLMLARLIHAVVAVCQTVSFAHSRGVLHRDLKPSNILLGAFGEVLVLDWGLAMEMRKEEGGRTKDEAKPNTSSDSSFTVHPSSFEQTEAGQVLGTPAYMAPEQAAGQVEQIDARTDVFGLGAILYEVLTGAPPFAGKQDGTRQPPVRPRRMDPQVAPALDAICVKALAHDPGARYMAAAALAEDLQRWLADEPVSAYPEPWTTRAGRWMRRHRAVVISALVLLVMGVAGLASTTVLVNQQRRRAEASLATALDAVDSFLVKISEEKLLYQPGLEPLRTELLRTARDFGDKFVKDSQDEPARRRELARMLLLLGKASAMSSDTKQALGDLNRARKLYRELQDRQPDDAGVNAGLARCQLEIGKASRQLGSPETKAELQAAVDLLEREPESADARRHLALAHYDLGLFFINANELADARKHLDQAIAADERAVQLEPDNWIHRSNLAAKLNGLGEWLKDQDKHEEAKTLLQSALEIRQRILDKGKINPLLEDGLAVAHNNLGHMALREKNLLAAESHFAAELKHCRHLAHQSPGVPRYRLLLGRAHSTTSNIHSLKKAPARALEEIARGVAILESLQEDYPEPPHAYELAVSHLNLAYRLREDGKDEMARNALDQAEKTVTPLVGDPTLGSKARLRLRDIHWTRAHIWGMQMRIPECLLAYERALQFDDGSEGKRLRLEHDAAAKLLKK